MEDSPMQCETFLPLGPWSEPLPLWDLMLYLLLYQLTSDSAVACLTYFIRIPGWGADHNRPKARQEKRIQKE